MTPGDFDAAFIADTEHRPWPLPAGAWVMTQSWHDLLFAHWPVDPAAMRALVPAVLDLDLFDGQAWIAVVPFRMANVVPRGLPALPGISAFPEINVRTYVTVRGRPGVFFFSLDATNRAAVLTARHLLHMPYYRAAIELTPADGWIAYTSRRTDRTGGPAQFDARYRPTGLPATTRPGTLAYFLTERYCLYTVDRRGRPSRIQVHHRPWPLQPAEAEITRNTMCDATGLALPARPPLLHFARRVDVVSWLPERDLFGGRTPSR